MLRRRKALRRDYHLEVDKGKLTVVANFVKSRSELEVKLAAKLAEKVAVKLAAKLAVKVQQNSQFKSQ